MGWIVGTVIKHHGTSRHAKVHDPGPETSHHEDEKLTMACDRGEGHRNPSKGRERLITIDSSPHAPRCDKLSTSETRLNLAAHRLYLGKFRDAHYLPQEQLPQ